MSLESCSFWHPLWPNYGLISVDVSLPFVDSLTFSCRALLNISYPYSLPGCRQPLIPASRAAGIHNYKKEDNMGSSKANSNHPIRQLRSYADDSTFGLRRSGRLPYIVPMLPLRSGSITLSQITFSWLIFYHLDVRDPDKVKCSLHL